MAIDGVIVRFDASKLTQENFKVIENLSEIIQDSGELGVSELDIFNVEIKSLKSKDLIQL